ncbi:MAG: dienelactone hydrolase family protein [Clostridia bacterium]|nr:dienelactone hydrolase family protein [Clostridia bacterium]
MKKLCVLLCVMCLNLCNFTIVNATDYVMKEKSIATSQLETFRFLQFVPSNQTAKLPLIIYLHGGSGKGDDLSLVRSYLFPTMFENGTLSDIDAYAVCPQVPTNINGWTQVSDSVFELIDHMCENYNIDERKISLIGHSMGGTGTWSLAASHPERFSCIVPMSGSIGNNDKNKKALGIMPIRAFVGSADTVVAPETSTEFVSSLKEINADCEMTVFEGATHFDVPELVFNNDEIDIINWVLSQEQTNSILTYGNGRVGVKISYPGKYTLIFTHFENGVLQNISSQEYDFEYGRSSKPAPFTLSSNDKVFLWNSISGMSPIAKRFVIK